MAAETDTELGYDGERLRDFYLKQLKGDEQGDRTRGTLPAIEIGHPVLDVTCQVEPRSVTVNGQKYEV